MSHTTKHSIATLAYYLRNQKLFTWDTILKITNFNHYFPKLKKPDLIKLVRKYAKQNELEPPISTYAHKSICLTYNLYVLGMPPVDIARFQNFTSPRAIHLIHERISILSKKYSLPNPTLFKKKVFHKYPKPTPNPQPLWVSLTPSYTIRVFNSSKVSPLIKRSHAPLYSLFKNTSQTQAHIAHDKIPAHIRRVLKQNPLQLLSPFDRVFLTLSLILKNPSTPPQNICKALGYSRLSFFIISLNYQLSKSSTLKLCHTDFISQTLNKTPNPKD